MHISTVESALLHYNAVCAKLGATPMQIVETDFVDGIWTLTGDKAFVQVTAQGKLVFYPTPDQMDAVLEVIAAA